jgi:hypothetical protein
MSRVGKNEWSGSASARGVVLTAAGPNMRRTMHELSLPTFRRFADAWGYDVRAVDLGSDGAGASDLAQQAKWAKVSLLRSALQDYELVLWLDADVLVVRTDEDIAEHLHDDHFQALAIEHVPTEHRVNPNTGVWLMRSCPEAFAFLEQVTETGPQPGPWADQGAVLVALGWDRGDERYHWARPGQGNAALAATSWLPPSWNQPWVHGRTADNSYNSAAHSYLTRPTVPDPHAVHFMGMTPTARHEHMERLAASLDADGAASAS